MNNFIRKLFPILLFNILLLGCSSNDMRDNYADEKPRSEELTIRRSTTNDRQKTLTVDENQQLINTATPHQLSFVDFKERWNALTDEQMSNLYIRSLEERQTEEGQFYQATLTNELLLSVFVKEQTVEKLVIKSEGKSQANTTKMLASWNQVITMLHTDINLQDVDMFFAKIGVGPNLDVSQVQETSLELYGIHYKVEPTETGFLFQAAYKMFE